MEQENNEEKDTVDAYSVSIVATERGGDARPRRIAMTSQTPSLSYKYWKEAEKGRSFRIRWIVSKYTNL